MLFLDEIHRMARPGRGDALPRDGGLPGRRRRRQGPGRHRHPARAAAVHPRRRHDPRRPAARARCATGSGSPAHLDFYEAAELDSVLRALGRPARRTRSRRDGATEIAGRSRGTPRIANRLLRRVRDYAQVEADGVVDLAAAPRRARALRRRRPRPRPARPRRCSTPCAGASAAARWAVARSPWPWARSARPSRRSPSRSSCAPGCSPVPRAAGSPPRPPGTTSGSRRRAPGAQLDVGLFAADAVGRFGRVTSAA